MGNTIRLYYPDTSARYDSAWLCVTLEAQDDGSYWFVSNQPSEQPAIPTVYPEGDPVLTIPLTDLTPYEPEAVEVTRHTGDCAERGGGYGVDSEDVIITSNAEKELPDAFLRRCVFHYIEFPDREQMERIVRVHLPDIEEALVEQALEAFYWLRGLRDIEKKPSTSELVDWLRALAAGGVDPQRITEKIPYAGVLLKKDKDLRTLARNQR